MVGRELFEKFCEQAAPGERGAVVCRTYVRAQWLCGEAATAPGATRQTASRVVDAHGRTLDFQSCQNEQDMYRFGGCLWQWLDTLEMGNHPLEVEYLESRLRGDPSGKLWLNGHTIYDGQPAAQEV